jgi:hypothetical protein
LRSIAPGFLATPGTLFGFPSAYLQWEQHFGRTLSTKCNLMKKSLFMDHLRADECWCNPTAIPVKRNDGSIGYVHAHHEPDISPESEAERAVAIYEAMEMVRLQTDA